MANKLPPHRLHLTSDSVEEEIFKILPLLQTYLGRASPPPSSRPDIETLPPHAPDELAALIGDAGSRPWPVSASLRPFTTLTLKNAANLVCCKQCGDKATNAYNVIKWTAALTGKKSKKKKQVIRKTTASAEKRGIINHKTYDYDIKTNMQHM